MEFKGYKGYKFITPQGDARYAFQCPCCELPTISEPQAWEICTVCHWEDDVSHEAGGANGLFSLSDARNNFKAHKHMYPSDHVMTTLSRRSESLDKCIALLHRFKTEEDFQKRGVIFAKFLNRSEWL